VTSLSAQDAITVLYFYIEISCVLLYYCLKSCIYDLNVFLNVPAFTEFSWDRCSVNFSKFNKEGDRTKH